MILIKVLKKVNLQLLDLNKLLVVILIININNRILIVKLKLKLKIVKIKINSQIVKMKNINKLKILIMKKLIVMIKEVRK